MRRHRTIFYARANPFSATVDFAYPGSGIASDLTVFMYDVSGYRVWTDEETNIAKITWDGTNLSGDNARDPVGV